MFISSMLLFAFVDTVHGPKGFNPFGKECAKRTLFKFTCFENQRSVGVRTITSEALGMTKCTQILPEQIPGSDKWGTFKYMRTKRATKCGKYACCVFGYRWNEKKEQCVQSFMVPFRTMKGYQGFMIKKMQISFFTFE